MPAVHDPSGSELAQQAQKLQILRQSPYAKKVTSPKDKVAHGKQPMTTIVTMKHSPRQTPRRIKRNQSELVFSGFPIKLVKHRPTAVGDGKGEVNNGIHNASQANLPAFARKSAGKLVVHRMQTTNAAQSQPDMPFQHENNSNGSKETPYRQFI